MQFLWKYLDDLMGKGLEISLLLEMLFYVSAHLIPLALPLAVLFSSIMTFGNLAEHNELTAFKSSGQSLTKVMKPMLIFVVILSISAFYFTNYVLPIANLKWHAIYFDILEKKPTFALKEGIFFKDFDGYHIKVDKKDEEAGTLNGILIYDLSSSSGYRKIRAEKGQMLKSVNEDKNNKQEYLFLQMENGVIYEDVQKRKFEKTSVDFQKTYFEEAIIKFNMGGFELEKTNPDLFKQDFEMMNFIQLGTALDSLKILNDTLDINFGMMLKDNFVIFNNNFIETPQTNDTLHNSASQAPAVQPTNLIVSLDSLHESELIAANLDAQNEIRTVKDMIYRQTITNDQRIYSLQLYEIAWHKKFTLSFAILILFFIGAPLGAIIKKGGLGTPLVFATLFFLLYYILTEIGENMVESGVVVPWKGLWLSAFILSPLGFFLTYKAANDSALFDWDVYKRWFGRIFSSKKNKLSNEDSTTLQ